MTGNDEFDFTGRAECPSCGSDRVAFNIAFTFDADGLPAFILEAGCRECGLERTSGFPTQ